MAATPYPTDYVYAGNAQTLTLKTAVSDGGGDLTLTVNEETSNEGWPSLGASQRLVIVVGRGTAYETKYAVKTITSSASGSTLTVDSADKTFDNTPVTAAPTGTEVEHCWSATEASTANDHMRTKSAHGADGELVDQNTAQLLSNKTVMTPTASGHPTTKAYVDAADALALPKAGGTMTGAIAMGSNKITGLAAGTIAGDAVRYEQALLLSGGTMTGNINANGNKVTGLAAASANGDAVRYEQVTPVYAIGVRSSNQLISTAIWTTITYTSETDPSSILSSGEVTLPTAGVWLVMGDAGIDIDYGNDVAILALEHNGTAVVGDTSPTINYTDPTLKVSTVIVAAASDTVRLRVYLNTTVPHNCVGARLAVVKIGL